MYVCVMERWPVLKWRRDRDKQSERVSEKAAAGVLKWPRGGVVGGRGNSVCSEGTRGELELWRALEALGRLSRGHLAKKKSVWGDRCGC